MEEVPRSNAPHRTWAVHDQQNLFLLDERISDEGRRRLFAFHSSRCFFTDVEEKSPIVITQQPSEVFLSEDGSTLRIRWTRDVEAVMRPVDKARAGIYMAETVLPSLVPRVLAVGDGKGGTAQPKQTQRHEGDDAAWLPFLAFRWEAGKETLTPCCQS